MKKIFPALAIMFIAFLSQVKGQSGAQLSDSTKKLLYHLAKSGEPSDILILKSKLYQLLNNDNEEALLLAHDLFNELKQKNTADSVSRIIQLRYPAGIFARRVMAGNIYKEPNPGKKVAMYQSWKEKFPVEKLGNSYVYSDVLYDIARCLSDDGHFSTALEYAGLITDTITRCVALSDIATGLAENGHAGEAVSLFKEVIGKIGDYQQNSTSDYERENVQLWYAQYSNSLADLLLRQKNFSEALQYARAAHDSSPLMQPEINTTYAKALVATDNDTAAFHVIEETVRQGKGTPEMKAMLKSIYLKVKGSNAGYDSYVQSLKSGLTEKVKDELVGKLINKPAANFTLKDIEGRTVSLKDLRGKIVILDFWATWCGPCKASFPAMKMAMEHFKNRPDVKFLFIHTWENVEHPAGKVKSFLAYNKYPFQVLMDLKNNSGINPVVKSYGVTGIPTKFVIDRKGNIRYAITGTPDGADAVLEELTEMIAVAEGKQVI